MPRCWWVLPGSQVRAHQQRGFCSERGGTQNARTYSTSPTSVITCQIAPSSPVRVGYFLLSQKYCLLSEYTYSTVSYPYSTHFPKLTVFYRIHQERTRIHKNTSMWKSVSTIFIESARIPQNTDRIPRRVGILQEFRIPLKNTAQNSSCALSRGAGPNPSRQRCWRLDRCPRLTWFLTCLR